MTKHPDHICRFDDPPQSCDCYDSGYEQGKRDMANDLLQIADKGELEELRREVSGYIKQAFLSDNTNEV
jgi:hypothetical protein